MANDKTLRLEFLRIDIDSLERSYRREVNRAINTRMQEAIVLLREGSPQGVDGELASSWVAIPARRQTVTFDVEYKLTNTDPKAFYKLFGRLAGKMPPEEPLERWTAFKMPTLTPTLLKQATFLIRRKIAQEGTERSHRYSVLGIRRDLSVDPGSIIDRMNVLITSDLQNLVIP